MSLAARVADTALELCRLCIRKTHNLDAEPIRVAAKPREQTIGSQRASSVRAAVVVLTECQAAI